MGGRAARTRRDVSYRYCRYAVTAINVLLVEDNLGDVLLVREAMDAHEIPYQLTIRFRRRGGSRLYGADGKIGGGTLP